MNVYILSTMTGNVRYCEWDYTIADLPREKRSVYIHGGAGIPSHTSGSGHMVKDDHGIPLWTSEGVVTVISDADYEWVKDSYVFKLHMDAGYLKVLNGDISGNGRAIEKQVQTMHSDGFGLMTKDKLNKKMKVRTGSPDPELDEGRL